MNDRIITKIKYPILKRSNSETETNLSNVNWEIFSLGEKNRDLNRTFEKLEQINDAKDKLSTELAKLKMVLDDKDVEIQNLKDQSERIRFDCEQEVFNTRLQVKEILDNQAATEALIDELSKYKQGYDEMQEGTIESTKKSIFNCLSWCRSFYG